MKRLLIPVCAVIMMSFSHRPANYNTESTKIVSKETKVLEVDLKQYYKQTRKELEDLIKDLSEEQMSFKPGPNSWSVSQCLEHIIKTEKMLFGMTKTSLEQPENPERRSEVKITDEQLIAGITDRSHKAQASESLMPNGTYDSPEAALDAFDEQRDEIMEYIDDLDDEDIRNYVSDSPFGPIDAYQSLLFVAGHTARHTLQIKEVMEDPNFPES